MRASQCLIEAESRSRWCLQLRFRDFSCSTAKLNTTLCMQHLASRHEETAAEVVGSRQWQVVPFKDPGMPC
jgi:hypothetical protein